MLVLFFLYFMILQFNIFHMCVVLLYALAYLLGWTCRVFYACACVGAFLLCSCMPDAAAGLMLLSYYFLMHLFNNLFASHSGDYIWSRQSKCNTISRWLKHFCKICNLRKLRFNASLFDWALFALRAIVSHSVLINKQLFNNFFGGVFCGLLFSHHKHRKCNIFKI